MNAAFPRILTLLRKERGLSQKKAAEQLGVSQALLSHYEKGIRECGLDFVVRVAELYDVSTDYLLGRTADKSGAKIAVDEIPENDPSLKENMFRGSVLPVLNKKLVVNSVSVIFDMLQRCNCKALTAEASAYLTLAVYAVFRRLYTANPKNPQALFSVPEYLFPAAVSGELGCTAAALGQLAAGQAVKGENGLDPEKVPVVSPDTLAREYPMFASSLLNLLKNAEARLQDD